MVVKDKKGQSVHGLKASDFTVRESGKPQQVQSFEEHTALTTQQAAAVPQMPKLPPGEFTNFVATPPTGALNIILYDSCNTSLKDQMFVRDQLIKYLKAARPDSRTAIFALGTHIVQIAGFTTDRQLLLQAITDKKPQQTLFSDDTSGGLTTSANATNAGNIMNSALGSYSTAIAAMEAPQTQYQAEQRGYITLDALNTLGRYLVTLPGRKNLIWFAGDFPTNFFPSENSYDGPYAQTAFLEDEYRDTVNLLSRAQVAVYPIGAQGLATDQANNASKANAQFANGGRGVNRQGNAEAVAHHAEFNNRSSEEQAMNQIAHDTGGEAQYNHNDLSRMVDDDIADGSNYYTLSYVPSDVKANEDFRSIKVNVAGGPYELSYRRGYFTDLRKRSADGPVEMAANAPSAGSSLTQALRPGAPQPWQILMKLKAYPTSTPDQTQILQGNDANPDAKVTHPPYRNYEVDAAVSVQGFRFVKSGDIYSTTADFVTYVYNADGTLINSQSNSAKISYTKEKLAEALKSGLHFSEQVSVPAKGAYFLRVAVHDNGSGHIGAVEFPVASVANLPIGGGATPASPPAQ